MNAHLLKIFTIAFFCICLAQSLRSQVLSSDSTIHPYHLNYWITGGIVAVGMTTNYLSIQMTIDKPEITDSELKGLNKNVINSLDRWAFGQNTTNKDYLTNFSNNLLGVISVLPTLLLFDKGVRNDWVDVLLIYMETMSINSNIYTYSFLGPNFQGRLRPMVYYENLSMKIRKDGSNRNSFYSNHVSSTTAATFFMARVYSDYHPEIGNNQYFLYGAALIPPLILGYIRLKALYHFPSDIVVGLAVGALCGIVVPELNLANVKNVKLSLFSSPESTGIAVLWQPNFLK